MQDRSEAGEGRRLTKGQQSRRSILEAALRVIAKGGVDALTHRRNLADTPLEDAVAEGFRSNSCALIQGHASDLVLVDETFEM